MNTNTLHRIFSIFFKAFPSLLLGSIVSFFIIGIEYYCILNFVINMPIETLLAKMEKEPSYITGILNHENIALKISLLNLFTLLLLAPINAGFIRVSNKVSKLGNSSITDLFYYYNSEYTVRILISVIVNLLFLTFFSFISVLISIPSLQNVLFILYYIYTFISIPLIILYDKSVKTSILDSYKLIASNFSIFFVIILSFFIGMSGIFIFGIGIIATLPIIYVSEYAVCETLINKKNAENR